MKRPRDKSFVNDPRAPTFMAVFGVFFFWACYHAVESQKITVGRIIYALLLLWVALCSVAQLVIQIAVLMKKKREAAAAIRAKGAMR